jgi:D-methionine transport system ATP-binding protein
MNVDTTKTLNTGPIIVKVENASKKYFLSDKSIWALQDVSLEVNEKTILGIIGKSGAGKSTLLRCLNALEVPDQGKVFFQGIDLAHCTSSELTHARHQIGVIFQHFNLLSRRTALENVMLPLEITGISKKVAIQRAQECLELVGLCDKENAYPSHLSGGQKQRVAIARAIACHTKLLLCDEATSALDPESTIDILHLLKELNQKLGLTIVLITHEMSVIRKICDTVCVMDQGSIAEYGSVEKILSSPQHPISQSFVQSFFQSELPDIIKEHVSPHSDPHAEIVLRLIFCGDNAQRPMVSQLARVCDVDLNIAGGQVDQIGRTTFGTLIVTMPNNPDRVARATHFLNQENILFDIVGYIPCFN